MPPYITRFQLPDGTYITVVVLDSDEFCQIVDSLPRLPFTTTPFTEEHLKAFKDAKQIPLISRGTATEPLFQRYEVQTDKMSICARGFAEHYLRTSGIGIR